MVAEASGCDGDGELARCAELLDEAGQRLTEILECGFLGVAFAVRSQTGAQLGVGAPHAVLVALHDDRHRYRAKFGNAATLVRFGD
jgi:hypothetical protein